MDRIISQATWERCLALAEDTRNEYEETWEIIRELQTSPTLTPDPHPPGDVVELVESIRSLKDGHYYCEDSWYSCPMHPEGCSNDDLPKECQCGADKQNERVESIAKMIAPLIESEVQRRMEGVIRFVTNDLLDIKESSDTKFIRFLADRSIERLTPKGAKHE